jgi:hypothetical protein
VSWSNHLSRPKALRQAERVQARRRSPRKPSSTTATPCCTIRCTATNAQNLKREFPRIPFYADFWQWAAWGEALMALHIGYETVARGARR